MNRSNGLPATAVGGLFALASAQEKEAVQLEGGWQSQKLRCEKHLPHGVIFREGESVSIIADVLGHPQTPAERIEITRRDLDPSHSILKTTFYLKFPEGMDLIATSDCNLWMKKFRV